MGVRVNETRHDHITLSVHCLFVWICTAEVVGGAYGKDLPIAEKDSAIGDEA